VVSHEGLRVQERFPKGNKMKSWIGFSLLLTTNAFANLHLAPPDFDTSHGRAVFVDFKTAQYDITYDVRWKKRPTVKTTINFTSTRSGGPVFDLIPDTKNAMIDGMPVRIVETVAPDGSKLRQVTDVIAPGEHTLTLENSFSENVRYNVLSKKVSSAFWLRDLKYRKFLEQYIPSNFEFDQYQIIMNLTFAGTTNAQQDIYTNGDVKQTSANSYSIVFPKYYTVSCPYFHTTPKGQKRRLDFTYKSIDGRDLPVTVYTSWWSRPEKFKTEAIKVFKELEADYGPWGHKGLVAYETFPGTGGMEHAGATQTSVAALDHEMLHSYFAKGVMPANGNSGWIDEAIASWRDKGYQRKPLPNFQGSNLGHQSVYKRNTDDRAYALGAEFMAFLDYQLQDRGGLKAFLKGYFSTYKHTVITQEHFKNNLEFFSGLDLTDAFNTYVWGENSPQSEEEFLDQSDAHKNLSKADLKKIL
jgi:hypothetical protein